MTLVELLVVLALLVVIGGMVVPVFTGSFAAVRLRAAAGDQVLTRWSQARAEAIETGEVRQFRYTPETGDYRIEPWAETVEDGRKVSSTTTDVPASAASATSDETSDESTAVDSQILPERITFHAGRMAVNDPLSGERQATSMQSTGDELSTPILFFPDGRTSEASVVLANDRRQYVRLTLRGLTGVGRATEVLSSDELQRADR